MCAHVCPSIKSNGVGNPHVKGTLLDTEDEEVNRLDECSFFSEWIDRCGKTNNTNINKTNNHIHTAEVISDSGDYYYCKWEK